MSPAAWRLIRTAVDAGGWQVTVDRWHPAEIRVHVDRVPNRFMGAIWRTDSRGRWRLDYAWISDRGHEVTARLRDVLAEVANGPEVPA